MDRRKRGYVTRYEVASAFVTRQMRIENTIHAGPTRSSERFSTLSHSSRLKLIRVLFLFFFSRSIVYIFRGSVQSARLLISVRNIGSFD